MELDYKLIGARIKEKRKNVGISQAQLAEMVFLSTKYISQIEREVRHLSLDSMVDIAVALDVSVDMLLFDKHYPGIEKSIYKILSFSDFTKNEQDTIMEIVSAVKTIIHNNKIKIDIL